MMRLKITLYRATLLSCLMLLVGCPSETFDEEPPSYSINFSNPPAVPLSLTIKDEHRISAGNSFLGIDSNGGVFAWGYDRFLSDVPEGLSEVVMVSAGYDHNLALRSDGSVASWGDAAVLPEGLTDDYGFVEVAAGTGLSLGLRADGTVIGWGEDDALPGGLGEVDQISAANRHFAALKRDGSIVSWFIYSGGDCDECEARFTAITYRPEFQVTSISVSRLGDVFVLSEAGEIYRFGKGANYQEKNELEGLDRAIAVSADWGHFLALGADGEVYSWRKETDFIGPIEQRQDIVAGIKAVDAGIGRSLALTEDNKIISWRPNITIRTNLYIDEMSRQRNIKLISHAMWVDLNGVLKTDLPIWHNFEARLSEIGNIIAIPSIDHMGFVITENGDVHLLVNNISLQLEEGRIVNFPGGVNKLFSDSKVIDIVPSYYGNLALNSDGSVFVFKLINAEDAEVISNPDQPELSDIVAVASGSFGGHSHYLALDEAGKIHAWGANEFGQIDVPAGLSDVVGISAGWYHSAALKKDGTVVTWGAFSESENATVYDNPTVPALTPTGVKDVAKIFSSNNQVFAVREDGTVVAWGNDHGGKLRVPKGLTDVTAISTNRNGIDALRSDGTVVTWGDVNYTIGMHEHWASQDYIDLIKVAP